MTHVIRKVIFERPHESKTVDCCDQHDSRASYTWVRRCQLEEILQRSNTMFSILVQCYYSVLPRKCVEKDADGDAESAPTTSPEKAASFRNSAKPPSTLFTSAYSQFSKIFTAQDRTLGEERETSTYLI